MQDNTIGVDSSPKKQTANELARPPKLTLPTATASTESDSADSCSMGSDLEFEDYLQGSDSLNDNTLVESGYFDEGSFKEMQEQIDCLGDDSTLGESGYFDEGSLKELQDQNDSLNDTNESTLGKSGYFDAGSFKSQLESQDQSSSLNDSTLAIDPHLLEQPRNKLLGTGGFSEVSMLHPPSHTSSHHTAILYAPHMRTTSCSLPS